MIEATVLYFQASNQTLLFLPDDVLTRETSQHFHQRSFHTMKEKNLWFFPLQWSAPIHQCVFTTFHFLSLNHKRVRVNQ